MTNDNPIPDPAHDDLINTSKEVAESFVSDRQVGDLPDNSEPVEELEISDILGEEESNSNQK